VACAAAAGCSIATALPSDLTAIGMTSAQLRTAYLACDRRSAQSILEVDEMIACAMVGDVLLKRDFGGQFELQLQWWRAARSASGATAAVPGGAEPVSISGSPEP
jgi:hypothetical protein